MAAFEAITSAAIDTATSGDQTIVAAATGKKIRVSAFHLVCTSAITVRWKSGSTNKGGAMAFAANGGISAAVTPPAFLFETAAGEALILNLSASTQVSGMVTYQLVPA